MTTCSQSLWELHSGGDKGDQKISCGNNVWPGLDSSGINAESSHGGSRSGRKIDEVSKASGLAEGRLKLGPEAAMTRICSAAVVKSPAQQQYWEVLLMVEN